MLWTHALDSFTAVGAVVVSVFVHQGDEHGYKNSFLLERRLMRSEKHCLCSTDAPQMLIYVYILDFKI